MNETELLNDFNGNLARLSKLIKSWNLIQISSRSKFDKLAEKILNKLYEGQSSKIKRIIESELCVTYGLYTTEFDADKLTNEIMVWWSESHKEIKSTDIQAFIPLIREIVTDISNENYNRLNQNCGHRIFIDDLTRTIEEYGNNIIPLPERAFDFVEKYNISEKRIDVYLPLWTREEGKSDLTLFISCYNRESKLYIEINDLRVL